MIRELTCIICPMGCNLTIEHENNEIKSINGFTCSRGKAYAESEFTNPVRTLTTTVKCENGEFLPVKTSQPIPKDKLFDAMKIINNCIAPLPIHAGDVIIDNVFGSSIVATKNIS